MAGFFCEMRILSLALIGPARRLQRQDAMARMKEGSRSSQRVLPCRRNTSASYQNETASAHQSSD